MVVIVGTILLCVGMFVYNVIRSLTYTAKAARAPKGSALGRESLSHAERLEQLPKLPIPISRYSRAHGRISLEDIPGGDPSLLLDRFEELVIAPGNQHLFFGRLSSMKGVNDACTSMLVGCRATVFTRFLGWVSLESYGSYVEWHLMFSEVRLSRTPSERESHFEYGDHQHERHQSRSKDDAGSTFFILIWDMIFSNLTTPENAKRADWFQRFMMDMWNDALEESAERARKAMSSMMPPATVQIPSQPQPDAVENPSSQRRRPERRD